MPNPVIEVIRVSAISRPGDVAGCIANTYRDGRYPSIRAIGASAVNQAIKAIIQARSFLLEDGYDIAFVAQFEVVDIEGLERTAVRLDIVERDR